MTLSETDAAELAQRWRSGDAFAYYTLMADGWCPECERHSIIIERRRGGVIALRCTTCEWRMVDGGAIQDSFLFPANSTTGAPRISQAALLYDLELGNFARGRKLLRSQIRSHLEAGREVMSGALTVELRKYQTARITAAAVEEVLGSAVLRRLRENIAPTDVTNLIISPSPIFAPIASRRAQ
jgi:hypothetical protein